MRNIKIYTDGSLRRTKAGIISGYGIYFPNKELNNVAAPFTKEPITNNRAELYAIYQAILRVVRRIPFDKISIYTDSEYSQKSINEWMPKWKKNNWKNSKNKPVENQDILMKIDKYMSRHNIQVIWIRSHTGAQDQDSINNHMADRLANKGADKYIYKKLNL